jgi:hypothetical protein
MASSLSQHAVRSLQREARQLIVDDGILNAPKILDSVVTLVERATGRPRLKTSPQQWTELTGMFTDLRVITEDRRPRRGRARTKGGAR